MKSKRITIQKNNNKNIFDELSSEWWNETGNFEALHSFNPIRIKFILSLQHNSLIKCEFNFFIKISMINVNKIYSEFDEQLFAAI